MTPRGLTADQKSLLKDPIQQVIRAVVVQGDGQKRHGRLIAGLVVVDIAFENGVDTFAQDVAFDMRAQRISGILFDETVPRLLCPKKSKQLVFVFPDRTSQIETFGKRLQQAGLPDPPVDATPAAESVGIEKPLPRPERPVHFGVNVCDACKKNPRLVGVNTVSRQEKRFA